MIFSQNLFRCPTPTCIVCRNWESNSSLLGPTPQLALPVEFLFEILCVGAHTPTCIACRISFRNSLCWGP
ncbi:hypothetical protein B7R57_10245 [Staphylococcus aureus]|nr:hypothetical protein B7473_08590 [Staphylococcus aureus]AUW99495.1 hypothetical protein B7R57_10245 [Staphylococcus aureus]